MNWKKFLLVLFFLLCIFNAYPQQKSSLDIFFFHSPVCKACLIVKEEFLVELEKIYQDNINIIFLNIKENDNLHKLKALTTHFGLKEAKVPAVFCAGQLIVGRSNIIRRLPAIIERSLDKKVPLFVMPLIEKSAVEDEFRNFSLLAIMGAGILDGINPCAFTVIIFFISFLAFYGYRRKEQIIIGSSYILAIFVTYLLIGIGLFGFLYSMRYFYTTMKLFYLIVALFCFLLSILSFYDYLKFCKTKDAQGSILQLPRYFKRKIHSVIGDEFRDKGVSKKKLITLFIGALSVGFMVSILEGICTGQVYLPVIVSVLKNPALRPKALMYLFIYNLMFIIPLVIVFLAVLGGISSVRFSDFLKAKFGLIRICMGILFLGLGIFLLWGVWF